MRASLLYLLAQTWRLILNCLDIVWDGKKLCSLTQACLDCTCAHSGRDRTHLVVWFSLIRKHHRYGSLSDTSLYKILSPTRYVAFLSHLVERPTADIYPPIDVRFLWSLSLSFFLSHFEGCCTSFILVHIGAFVNQIMGKKFTLFSSHQQLVSLK